MAQLITTLTAETELIHDAIDDLQRIMRALIKCHGYDFRALERRIEALMEGEVEWGEPRSHWIGGGRIVFEPFPVMKEIIRDARALGVI